LLTWQVVTFMKIVIIDDDEDEIDFMKESLNVLHPQWECRAFSDCDKALLALQDEVPDYIFLDVNMKKIDGEECLRMLKGIPGLWTTKIIMISSSMQMYDSKRRQFIALGAAAVTEKPDNMDDYGEMFSRIIVATS
jgi:CheY-like chemotaxis protein